MEDKENLKGMENDWKNKAQEEDSEDFGLPHVTYNPLDKDEHSFEHEIKKEHATFPRDYEYEEKTGSPFLVVMIILLLIGGIGGGVYWFMFRDKGEVIVNTDPQPIAPVIEEVQEEPEPVQEFDMPVLKTTGDFFAISSPSGSYYVVVGSYIDDDLAKDQSNRLNTQGFDTYLISPTNNKKFYRLAVANSPSLDDATYKLDELKMNFGQDIWVLKY